MSDHDVFSLGAQASRLLRDPMFTLAMERAEQLILDEWSRTEPRENARREELHAELRALRRVKGRISAMEIDGRQVDDRRRLRS